MENFRGYFKYYSKKILHRIKAKHRKGYGIHSPFVFNLLTCVIEAKIAYRAFEMLELQRKSCVKKLKKQQIEQDYLWKSTMNNKYLKTKRVDQLIFRLANHFAAKTLYEIGGGIGISTAYLAKIDPKSAVFFVNDEKKWSKPAQQNWEDLGLANIFEIDSSDLYSQNKPIDFVHFTTLASSEKLVEYWNCLKNRLHPDSIVIISDIYRNKQREDFWNTLKKDEIVKVSIDIFKLGLLIFKKGMQKENYAINVRAI